MTAVTAPRGHWGLGVPLALAGPALVGAALGIPHGAAALATRAVLLPAVVVGVAAIMMPALYIGAAFLGIAPSARHVVVAAGSALGDTGLVFLGLAPGVLFLVAASAEVSSVAALGYLTVALAVAIGLRALYLGLFAGEARRSVPLFACWSAVSLGIGARLMLEAVPL